MLLIVLNYRKKLAKSGSSARDVFRPFRTGNCGSGVENPLKLAVSCRRAVAWRGHNW
jgi:hypothetical protein